jgi:hypothetical protein
MRWFLLFVAAVSLAALCDSEARAHGGSYGHGTRGPFRAPSIPCDCAKPYCLKCSAPGLAEGANLSRRETKVEVVETWGDLARVKTTTAFATDQKYRFLEAYASIEVAPLLAVTAGTILTGDHEMVGVRAPSQEARRDYLWERNWSLRDPMLVARHDESTVHVRAFPIAKGVPTTVTLEGYTLAPAPESEEPRFYRTGDVFLRVSPTAKAARWLPVDFWDEKGGRAIQILDLEACTRWFPKHVESAVEVPCVPALVGAITSKSDAAVNQDTLLVAVTPRRKAPKNLYVGKPGDAPITSWGSSVPPGLREPRDPVPPPPPPA